MNLRTCCAVICVVFSLVLCGCTSIAEISENSIVENNAITALTEAKIDTKSPETNTSSADTESETEAETEVLSEDIITEAELYSLFEENLYCLNSVFMTNHLAYSGDAVIDAHIYRVSDNRFGNYTDFENYIRSVYCTAEADRLLYHYPYENTHIYTNIEGMLCIDTNYANAKAYFINWTDAQIVVNSTDEKRCEFSVMGYAEEPADVPVQEEYIAYGAVVFENGKWVLETMVY